MENIGDERHHSFRCLSDSGQEIQKVEQKIEVQKGTAATFAEIHNMGRRTLMGKVEFSK